MSEHREQSDGVGLATGVGTGLLALMGGIARQADDVGRVILRQADDLGRITVRQADDLSHLPLLRSQSLTSHVDDLRYQPYVDLSDDAARALNRERDARTIGWDTDVYVDSSTTRVVREVTTRAIDYVIDDESELED